MDAIVRFFEQLSIAAVVAERVMCIHGGLSRSLLNLNQINNFDRPVKLGENDTANELLWSDPSKRNGWSKSPRSRSGCIQCFGGDVFKEQMKALGLEFLIRAHQVATNGTQGWLGRKLVTVFSAAGYNGRVIRLGFVCVEQDNRGGLVVTKHSCSMATLNTRKYRT